MGTEVANCRQTVMNLPCANTTLKRCWVSRLPEGYSDSKPACCFSPDVVFNPTRRRAIDWYSGGCPPGLIRHRIVNGSGRARRSSANDRSRTSSGRSAKRSAAEAGPKSARSRPAPPRSPRDRRRTQRCPLRQMASWECREQRVASHRPLAQAARIPVWPARRAI